ncbi:MAG: terminase small subunit [Mucilaginibacter sp.]|jgi:hypothetical protein|uniref:terminase small subunit n=1 Tax=Mucilaginibacter sp. TaxID=1882438 RepID=UPI00356921F2
MKHLKDLKQLKSYRARINKYFTTLQGEYHIEKVLVKGAKDNTDTIDQKVWDREPEPATLSGLALAIGFTSINEMEAYERDGEFADIVKKARLRVEAEYEKRLHFQSSTGAIFMLKSQGWAERPDDSLLNEIPKTIQIEIINSGPKLADSEKDVAL